MPVFLIDVNLPYYFPFGNPNSIFTRLILMTVGQMNRFGTMQCSTTSPLLIKTAISLIKLCFATLLQKSYISVLGI